MARQRRLCRLVGLLLLICATSALKCPDRTSSPGRELVCYTSSSELDQLENAICSCTTLVHQGHELRTLNASDVKKLRDSVKEANPDIRVVLSVNDKDELLKNSATTRQDAAGYLINVLKEVDGVELNVTAGSKDRLVSFLKGLRDDMVNKSLEKMILLALPTRPEDLAKQFELKELSKYVDLFTIGTHYLRDSDEAYRSFHPSRLMGLFDMLNTDSLVDLISGMGAPKHKILISAPTSAYQFTLKKAKENTPRSPTVEELPVVFNRKKLCEAMSDGEWTVERDEDLTAPYAFKNTTWIAFEDETSLKIKGKYIILRELAGLGLRDVENDLKNDCGVSLAQSVSRAFTEMKRKTREVVLSSLEKDLKGTEIAYPRHVRSSDFRIVRVVDTAGKIRAVRENTQTAFTCTRQGYFVHPKSCNRFYRCVKFNQEVDDYSVFEFDCPAGLAFDERAEVCVWPGSLSSGSACPGSSEIEPVPRGRFRCPSRAGFYADPQNCRWFFACYDLGGPEMVPYEFRCPFGLVFDEHRLVCEWPWKVPNCNDHGHGDGHNVYNFGGSYGGQEGYVPQGGIIGQGGFVGQTEYAGQGIGVGVYNQGGQDSISGGGAYGGQNVNAAGGAGTGAVYDGQIHNTGNSGAGVDYDGQNVNIAGGASAHGNFNGQTYNAGGVTEGGRFDGQPFNAGGTAGVGSAYDEQNYNAAGGVNTGGRFDGQTYNAGADGNYDEQTYNAGGATGTGAAYDGQNFNAAGGITAGADGKYDGQTYNAGADGRYDGQTYNTGGAVSSGGGYDGQNFNAAGGVATGADGKYDGQIHNVGGAAGAGVAYNGQNFNSAGGVSAGADGKYNGQTYNAGADGKYDGQTYNAGGAVGSGVGYDGQNFNAAGGVSAGVDGKYDGQTYNAGADGKYDGQTYNAGGAVGSGVGYDGQHFNTAGSVSAGADGKYDGQTYNAGADGKYDGQTYNAGGAVGSGTGYDGQNFNAAGGVNAGADGKYDGQTYNAGADGKYDGQTYNAGGAVGSGTGYDGQNFNAEGGVSAGADGKYDGQTYNEGADGKYDGQTYNAGGAVGSGIGYGGQHFNPAGSAATGGSYDGQTYNANGAPGAGASYDGHTYNAGVGGATGTGIDYDEQNYNAAAGTGAGHDGQVLIGPENSNAHGPDCDNQNFNGNGAVDYDDRGGATSGYNAQGGTYANGGVQTTQFNAGNTATTVGANNFAGITRTPSGFTAPTSNLAGGSTFTGNTGTVYTAGITRPATSYNNFISETGSAKGITPQNTLITGDRFSTNFVGSTNDLTQNTNFNVFDASKTPARLSTISYGNAVTGQSNTGLFATDNSQYTGTAGPTVYNASYNAGSGYPTSTIIPFVPRQNTFTGDYQGTTPVNSVIYHSHLAMGLTTTENFGNQYTNQAEKSFATQGRTPTGFGYNGRTQNTQNFNTATNIYNSKNNLAGITPSIELVRDGVYNSGGTPINNPAGTAVFGGSTTAAANFNTGLGSTNTYDNSQIIGSSITSSNNDITKFRESTKLPEGFRFNQNTATDGGFRTDSNSATFYNQGTTANQNAYPATGFTQTFAPNAVTPASITQNFNTQGTPVPGVVPLNNNIRPSIELDNSGIFGTKFAGPSSTTPINIPSTTPQSIGYKTNEYYDNGGRGTIRYNNGLVANKVTENDIQDYRTSPYTRLPNSFIINAGNGENAQSTIQKADSADAQQFTDGTFTRGGFTKTGPTKTGITTAQVGGSGSYVIGTGVPRARPNPQLIGEQAFTSSFGTTGSATNFNNAGTATNFGAAGTTTNFGTAGSQANFGARDSTTNFGATGNAVNFGAKGTTGNFGTIGAVTNFGATGTTTNFGTSQLSGGFTATDISKSNTASGTTSETAGYSYPKPLIQLEINGISTTPGVTQNKFFESTTPSSIPNIQSLNNQNSIIVESSSQNNRGFSTTISPVGFTTGQLENFKTTVYQAAKLPQTVTTVQPVIDTGFKTVISSTPVPAIVSTPGRTYQTDDFSNRPYLGVGVSFDQSEDYASSAQGLTGSSDYSDVSTNLDQGNFGQRVNGQTRFTNINYQQPTTNINTANQNSPLITSTQDYNTQTVTTAQTLRNNEATDFRSTVTIPNQVYLPSSTIAPATGVTFSRPIVAAEFSQGQSTATFSQDTNSVGLNSRGSVNRILSNQASANFAPQRPASGVLINQASSNSANEGSVNGILNNQASTGFTSQESADEFFNRQGSVGFSSQGSTNGVYSNQASANFGSRGSLNGAYGNQASTASISYGSQGSANNQGFNNQAGDFTSRGSSNRILNNQASVNSFSGQNQGFNGQTRTLVGSNVVTSIGGTGFTEDILRQNAARKENVKIISEFNSADNANFGRIQSSTLAPEVTTYAGDFSRLQTRIESNSGFNTRNQNKKVVVKLSDLHPLILGKLGAECTCKADPFAVFRGPNRQSLPINSQNRGPVDLANYDESDIYVDLDNDKENEREIDFIRNIPSNRLIKPLNVKFNQEDDDSSIVVSSRGEPSSSTYLPPTTARPTSTYLPPASPSNVYLPSSTEAPIAPVLRVNQASLSARSQNRQPLLIRVEDDNLNRPTFSRGRSGKALFDGRVGSPNDLRDQSASFDRYGSSGLRNSDETLQGGLECARPGLFRHPKFCNKFYACHWDEWKKRYTLHVFNCPVHLAFDASAGACNYPSKGPACQDNKLLV